MMVVKLAHPGRHLRRHGWHTRPTCKRATLPAATTTLARPCARAGRRQTRAAVPTPPGVASQHTLRHCIHLLLLVQRGSGYRSNTCSLTHATQVFGQVEASLDVETEHARAAQERAGETKGFAEIRDEVAGGYPDRSLKGSHIFVRQVGIHIFAPTCHLLHRNLSVATPHHFSSPHTSPPLLVSRSPRGHRHARHRVCKEF